MAGDVNAAAEKIIAQLGLARLPQEDGFFRQVWLTPASVDGRAAGSGIWYLLTPEVLSALHRLQAEESWRFLGGDPVEHVSLDPRDGRTWVTVLGAEARLSHRPELTVPGGVWQGARLKAGAGPHGWALLSCTLRPAWDEKEFELGSRAALEREFPGAREWIGALTR